MNTIKRKGSKYAILALLAVFAVAACKSPKKLAKTIDKIEFKAEPEVLEVHGDSVTVNVKGKFPPHSFAKNAIVKFQPVLRYGSQEKPLKIQYLKGEKVQGQADAKKINYQKGGTFTYTDKFEYTPEMKESNMSLDYNIKLDSKYDDLDQCQVGKKDSAVRGTITTSLTVKPTDDILMYNNDKPDGGTPRMVTFYYVINEGRLRDSVMKGPTIQRLRDYLSDTTYTVRNILFNSFASPDGELQLNVDLTKSRAESSVNAVKKELKRMKMTQVYDSNLVQKPSLGEDWDGLRRLVMQSDIQGKDEVMTILNSGASNDDKEAQLRKTAGWNDLKNNILPRLRRTEVLLSGTVPNRSIEELRMMSASSYNGINKKELILLANNSTDTAEQSRIYKYMMEQYPEDWIGKNNYAAMMLKNGQYEPANTMFEELHAQYPNNDTINNNLGVAKRFIRKYNDSKDLYTTAQGGGVPENNNLGILYIKYGDYENSISSFEPDRCDYNVALAYTLKGDYDKALQKIECIDPDSMTADVYYLRAIVGARKNDRSLMTTSLTQAIQKDAKFRDMAKKDLEFRNYWDADDFKNAIR